MIRRVLKRKLLPAVMLSVVIAILAFTANITGWNQTANIHKFNQFETPASQNLVIIEIDEESVSHFNTWPWPRSRFAEFLYKLELVSPELVVFDVDFSAVSNQADDVTFGNAINNVSFPVILPTKTRASKQMLARNEVLPIEPLAKYSLLGSVDIKMEKSGLVHEYPTFSESGRPTMGALLANRINTPEEPVHIDFSIDPLSIPYISFKDIVTGNFDEREIRGKTLLVGATSQQSGDMYTLPKHGRLPNVYIHALGYETLIADTLLSTVSPLIMLFLAITLFILLTFSHDDKRLGLALVSNFVIIAAIYALSFILHAYAKIMLPVTILYVAMILSCAQQIIQNIKYRTYILFKETNRNNYNKALVNQVIKESVNGIIITDLQGGVLVANSKAQKLFTMDHQTVENNESVFDYIPGSRELFEKVSQLKALDFSKTEYVTEKFKNKGGQEYIVEMMLNKTSFVQYFDNHKFFGGHNRIKSHEIFNFTIQDVTEKMKILAEKDKSDNALSDLMNNDPLTKLPNRASFNKILELLYSNKHVQKNSIVVLLNLDSIKEINDMHGLDIGDDAIYKAGRMLNNIVGSQGMVARFSEKIFGIIYSGVDSENADHYKELIRQLYYLFSKPLRLGNKNIPMAVSMGVVIAPKHGDSPDTLISNAVQALDYSKASKSTKWFIYQEDLAQKLRDKREIRLDLQRAIKNDEFVLYYQPQHDIVSGKLLGYESLIRWEDPIKGLRFPDEFIPVAEEFGLITEIGELVLKTGCHDAVHWPDDITVAINVSPIQFKDADMVALCRKYLKQSGLAPERLELEITESMMMDDVDHVIETLTSIQDLGVKIAMDDFGTGYSSLQYLTELPFDKIKIDRSFIMNIGKSKQADALISTIVTLGHSLDKLVLAEGIETEEMIIMLRAAGCQMGQGYHYGKPMPIKHVRSQLDLIEKQRRSA
uniref:EAL domain-containing protein n=1 Tax=OCS116 cluster bacterium TaxID=2030921 RepID=A0A2A4YRI0_9PROT